jgi:hypothetical protein
MTENREQKTEDRSQNVVRPSRNLYFVVPLCGTQKSVLCPLLPERY